MGAFDNRKPPVLKKRPGLKISNENSMFANAPKKPTPQESAKVVKEALETSHAYKERAAELAIKFRACLEDKTLTENKGIFAPDLEREVIGQLAQLAVDMNLDENEDDSMGSVGLITLLFRCLLIQRDKINTLDHDLFLLKKDVKALQSTPVDVAKKSE